MEQELVKTLPLSKGKERATRSCHVCRFFSKLIMVKCSVKECLFAYYGGLVLVVVAGALGLFYCGMIKPEALYTVIGGTISFAYFFQKQKLEETSLFRQLFDRFNERYNGMNEKLAQILLGDAYAPLTSCEIQVLVDYFNLCAEEYLYYRRGYIPRVVWGSWYNGMMQYYANVRIRTRWDEELKTQSYYGFMISGVQPTTASGCG